MIKTEFQYIKFINVPNHPARKTDIYYCFNRNSNDRLGIVKWHGAWRQYCFFVDVEYEVIFSKGCIKDISDFIDSLMAARR